MKRSELLVKISGKDRKSHCEKIVEYLHSIYYGEDSILIMKYNDNGEDVVSIRVRIESENCNAEEVRNKVLSIKRSFFRRRFTVTAMVSDGSRLC